MSALHLEEKGTIFDASERPIDSCANAFTSLKRLASGVLLAGFQSGPKKHAPTSTIRLCRSSDQGRTWVEIPWRFETRWQETPGSLASADLVETSPGHLLLFTTWFDRSEPDRPLFDPETQGILHARLLVAESNDDGSTWSAWREIATPGLTGCAATGPVLRWPDGTIGFAFESFKEYDDPRPGGHGAWLQISHDGGLTFPERHLVAQHPRQEVYFWDQRLCEGEKNGEYVALFWTHDLKEQQDLTVHLRRGSIDDPSPPLERIIPTPIPGQIAAPLLLPNDRLLAFVVDRNRPGVLRLCLSSDGGKTWPEGDWQVIHRHDEQARLTQGTTNIDFNEYWEDMAKWTFGHPAIVRIDEDVVLLAYYAGTPSHLSIHWARVRLEPYSSTGSSPEA